MAINLEKFSSVGVITRTKNRPQLLRRCIESILSQTFTDWVHVVVNDGGNVGDAAAILNSYGEDYKARSILLNHENSLGMEAASNTALRKLETEFVAFLDDDDTWHTEFLATMINTLRQAHGDTVKGVVCQTEIVHEKLSDGQIVEERREPFNSSLKQISLSDLLIENQFTNNSFLYRRSVLDKIGFYDEQLEALGDWDFNLRFFFQFDAVVIDKILARWHWRDKSASGSEVNSVYRAENPHLSARTRLLNDAIRGKWFGGHQNMAVISIVGKKLNEITSAFKAEGERKAEADRLLHTKVVEQAEKIDRLHVQLSDALRENDRLHNSLSWRITSPLRKIRSFIR